MPLLLRLSLNNNIIPRPALRITMEVVLKIQLAATFCDPLVEIRTLDLLKRIHFLHEIVVQRRQWGQLHPQRTRFQRRHADTAILERVVLCPRVCMRRTFQESFPEPTCEPERP